MPAEAQRLLARLISRKGPLVRVDSLNFREIDDTAVALTHLVAQGFVCWCPEAPAADLARLLTRAELAQCFEDVLAARAASPLAATENGARAGVRPADAESRPDAPPSRPPVRKGEYLEWIERSLGDSEVHRRIEGCFPWVALDIGERLELYRLLFFGDRRARPFHVRTARPRSGPLPRVRAGEGAAAVRRSGFPRRLCRAARPWRSRRRTGLDAARRMTRCPCSRRCGSPTRTASSSVAAAAYSTGWAGGLSAPARLTRRSPAMRARAWRRRGSAGRES